MMREAPEPTSKDSSQEKRTIEGQEALACLTRVEPLIPICTNCKKIRNARGAWQPLETYISERSKATFSHEICPACVQRLYPEIYEHWREKQ